MNLYPDNCRPYTQVALWLPGRVVAATDLQTPISAKARGHVNKAVREGYTCTVNQYDYRNERISEILAINQSRAYRQGRPMDDSYNYPKQYGPQLFCEHHVFKLILCVDRSGSIVGYIELYIIGEFAQTSRVLGHAEHLKAGIMDLLFVSAFNICRSHSCKWFAYGEWYSGMDGLRTFRASLGFKPVVL